MDSRKIVYRETLTVLIGELICTAVMLAVFALLGRFDLTVILGSLAGMVLAVGNFFAMAITAILAGDKASGQDVASGKKLIQMSYTLRLVVLFVLLFACAKSGLFNLFALVLPLTFIRPALTIVEFFRKEGKA